MRAPGKFFRFNPRVVALLLLAVVFLALHGGQPSEAAESPQKRTTDIDVGQCLFGATGVSPMEALVLIDSEPGASMLESSREYMRRKAAITSLQEKGFVVVRKWNWENQSWVEVSPTVRGNQLKEVLLASP